jgi:uncharacterized protein YjbJ (UPF0337 family)
MTDPSSNSASHIEVINRFISRSFRLASVDHEDAIDVPVSNLCTAMAGARSAANLRIAILGFSVRLAKQQIGRGRALCAKRVGPNIPGCAVSRWHGPCSSLEHVSQGGTQMNWDRIEGQWKQLKGKAQQRWGKLTDDDWDMIGGQRTELVGRVQELYGKQKDQAERDVEEWERGLN